MVQHFRRTHPGIDVVSVDVGEDAGLVRPFAAQFKMGDVALDPDQTVAHAFGVTGYPTMFAIDAAGACARAGSASIPTSNARWPRRGRYGPQRQGP